MFNGWLFNNLNKMSKAVRNRTRTGNKMESEDC